MGANLNPYLVIQPNFRLGKNSPRLPVKITRFFQFSKLSMWEIAHLLSRDD